MKTYIIAEAGVAHRGYFGIAARMIEAAKKMGADCIKFQAFVPKLTAKSYKSLEEILLLSYFDVHQLSALKSICAQNEIDFLCSAFEEENLDWLAEMGEKRVKIPSCRNANRRFLQSACAKFDEVIISTGMMTKEEVDDLYFNASSKEASKMTLLHCVSSYPCPFNEINLWALWDSLYSGLSDHTIGWEVPVAAVALGAQIIEKHFTLKRDGGVDDCVSLEPDEFADMVKRIRNVEMAMGDGVKRIMPGEKKLLWRKKR